MFRLPWRRSIRNSFACFAKQRSRQKSLLRSCSGGKLNRWRTVNSPHLVASVRAGVKFEKGVIVERPEGKNEEVAA